MPVPPFRVEVRSAPPEEDRALRELLATGDSELAAAELEDVVCVVRDAEGALAGLSTTVPADVALVGGQRFGIYAAALVPGAEETADALLSATWAAGNARHDPGDAEGPIGLCLLLADPAEMERRPEARWQDPPMLYMGYLDDGRQVRVGYYEGARLRQVGTGG